MENFIAGHEGQWFLLIKITMRAQRAIQCIIYSVAGLTLGFAAFLTIMVGVWGVYISPLLYLAFFSCIALIAGAGISLFDIERGRTVAFCALAGIGTVWIPSIASLIPQHDVIVSKAGYFIFGAYFAILAFVLFFPHRQRFSVGAFLIICAIAGAFGEITYLGRLRQGEYARPSFAYFRWFPDQSGSLVVTQDPMGWIDPGVRTILDRAGIRGTLMWTGSSGSHNTQNRVIVLARSKPPAGAQLFHPRNGVIVYAYDGFRWLKLPADAPVYPSFGTLESFNSQTMLYESVGGGRQGSAAFLW